MSRSNFSQDGLDIGHNTVNMTYLYGISDFFSVMFEDTDRLNLLLEANSEAASEVYNRFLQMTSTISLENIQNTSSSSLKLIIVKNTDSVSGQVNVFKLPYNIQSTRYIANRPLLPTSLLEENVDFRIEDIDGQTCIRFSRDISNAGFSTRLLKDGTTKEYAFWFVDCEIDEQWISQYYASLIGVDPQSSTDIYKNFIYGLYYTYIQGPTLDLIRKGLNLCLGVPLSRGNETVLDIRKYLETDQYIVITDANQYLIPYGLEPSVQEGDQISLGDELAQWVEVKDYIHDGEWWINLMIPSSIIPNLPEGQVDRYATAGSHFDQLMRNYLKKHTFLVNVKVQDFKNVQMFQQLSQIIHKTKPAYTQPVYIWSIPKLEETVELSEDFFTQRLDAFRCENISVPIEKFYRGNSVDATMRGCPAFLRYNVNYETAKLCGYDNYISDIQFPFEGGIANRFINPMNQYRTISDSDRAWLRTILDRNGESLFATRSSIGFTRNVHTVADASLAYRGVPEHNIHLITGIPTTYKIVPLYLTTQDDIVFKCQQIGINVPDMVLWWFKLFDFDEKTEINSIPINSDTELLDPYTLSNNYNLLMFRGANVTYLSNIMPEIAWRNYAPSINEVKPGDFMLGVRVYGEVVGVYWVTSQTDLKTAPFWIMEENDQMEMQFTAPPTRGMGKTSSPYYLIRGRGLSYNNGNSSINQSSINNSSTVGGSSLNTSYTDNINFQIGIDRSGTTKLAHKTELK